MGLDQLTKINTEDSPLRVGHLLEAIGKDGQDIIDTFSLLETDQKDIVKVLQAFETRCTPITNVIYERYIFNKRAQETRVFRPLFEGNYQTS